MKGLSLVIEGSRQTTHADRSVLQTLQIILKRHRIISLEISTEIALQIKKKPKH